MHYRFTGEAKRLWELHAHKPHITTVHAGIILNVIHYLCGIDEIGLTYRARTIAMANELDLFKFNEKGKDDDAAMGNAYTAWALYNWES